MRHFLAFKSLSRNTGDWVLPYAVNEQIPLLPLIPSVIIKCLFLATLRNLPNQIHTNPFSETTLIPKPNSLKLLPFSFFFQFQKNICTTRNQGNHFHGDLRFMLNIYKKMNENTALRNFSPHKHEENTNEKWYDSSMLKINNKYHHFMYFHWRNDTLSRMSLKYIIEHQTKLSSPPFTCMKCLHKYTNVKTQDPCATQGNDCCRHRIN